MLICVGGRGYYQEWGKEAQITQNRACRQRQGVGGIHRHTLGVSAVLLVLMIAGYALLPSENIANTYLLSKRESEVMRH